jgi:hypothetical protein
MKNKINKIHWLDALFVLLNIAAGRGNYLLYYVLGVSKATWVAAFVILVDIVYVFLRFKNKSFIKHRHNPILVYLIFILLSYNILNVTMHGGTSIYIFEILLIDVLFYVFLSRLYYSVNFEESSSYQFVKYASAGYICIALISVIGVFISFVLLQMGFNHDETIAVDFMESNIDDGLYYVRSFFTINYITNNIRLPFFQDFGYLCGLFHEPHVLAYGVFPGLILLFGLTERKIYRFFVVISMVLIILFTVSATNILVSLVCLVVFIFVKARRNFISALIISLVIGLIVVLYVNYDNTVMNFVLERLDSDNSSQQTSKDLLLFAFTPKTLIGTDFFSTSYVKGGRGNQDIGFVVFFMFIVFLIKYFHNIIKLLRINRTDSLTIGIASLYFILHSLKIGMSMFMQTLPVLIIFLQFIVLDYYGRNKVTRRHLQ